MRQSSATARNMCCQNNVMTNARECRVARYQMPAWRLATWKPCPRGCPPQRTLTRKPAPHTYTTLSPIYVSSTRKLLDQQLRTHWPHSSLALALISPPLSVCGMNTRKVDTAKLDSSISSLEKHTVNWIKQDNAYTCLLYTSPSPRDS
eukprot:TRINITY_DN3497_c0_g3_i14.p1 TRINITY_DN3497_c0_g3~~TRINITY_DN3497_c0_g3_i14.p1  ORF type:complete len:148 (+),score=7.03 TRINITY_DN3497_c0_g3_i14:16-459(+)